MANGNIVGFSVGKSDLVCLLPFLFWIPFCSNVDCTSTWYPECIVACNEGNCFKFTECVFPADCLCQQYLNVL